MDRYFMILASLTSCEAENAKVLDAVCDIKVYLRRITTSNHVENNTSNEFIKCYDRVYLSVLYTSAFEIIHPGCSKNSEWTSSHGSSYSDDDAMLCSPLPAKSTKSNKKLPLEDAIHRLCDKLPIMGTCLVDVICVMQKIEDLPVLEERVELFGALNRLVHWHRANLTIAHYSGDARSINISCWADLLPFRTVQSPFHWDRLITQNVVWAGGIHLREQLLSGFQLVCAENCTPSITKDCPSINRDFILNNQSESSMVDRQSLDGAMTILGRFPLSSIPPHAVSTKRFYLSLPNPPFSSLLENSAAFLSQTNADKDICYVLRLGIWTSHNVDSNPMDTIAWKRRVVAGNYKVPDNANRKEIGHHLFLFIGDGLSTKRSATVFVLRNTDDYCPETCLHAAIADARSTHYNAVKPNGALTDSFLKHLPVYSSQDVTLLRETLLEKEVFGIENLIDKMGNEIPAVHIKSIFKEIGSSVISNVTQAINANKGKSHVCNYNSPDGKKGIEFLRLEAMKEPVNWPERIMLKRRDALHKCHGELEHSLNPGAATFLKIDELLTRLQSEEKCRSNILTKASNSEIFPPSPQFRPCWPEAMYGNFPDVHYCTDQGGEIKQQQLNCLEARHIAYDTASSLNIDSEDQDKQATPRLLSLIKSTEGKHVRKTIPKKQSIRTQPLKQTRSTKDKKVADRNGLSEKNLQKLRIAVVDVLEMHNICLEHPLFKTCAKKLFTICQTFAKDVIGTGSASKLFKEIAASHVQQVVHFETKKPALNLRNKR